MADNYTETPSDVIAIAEGLITNPLKYLSDSQSIADSSVQPHEVWWGMIKWRTACHSGI